MARGGLRALALPARALAVAVLGVAGVGAQGVSAPAPAQTCADQPPSVISTLADGSMSNCGAVEAAGYCTSPNAGTRALVEENCPVTCGLCEPAGQTIVIGGAQGWVVKPGNAEYDSISANVGDTLVFTYSPSYHDVMLMDNEDCDFSTGQLVDDTGDFAWTIPEPGTYIFACSRGDHCSSGNQQIIVTVPAGPVWAGTTVDELFNEYPNIFQLGNRNAASHLWSTFVLDRAWQMTETTFKRLMGAFCPVSGSPVRIQPGKRWRVTLEASHGPTVSEDLPPQRTGYVSHCCWPCSCDAQDFLKLDTKTVQTADGPQEYWFTVMGNPCLGPRGDAIFSDVFISPFDGQPYTLSQSAREVRCADDGSLIGATLSDGGYPIIGIMQDSVESTVDDVTPMSTPVPGQLRLDHELSFAYSDARDLQPMCDQRAASGYASGMGEIFRQVASVVPVAFDSNREYCLGDVTGDMVVDVSDLLSILSAFGSSGDQAQGYDVVEDAVIDVNDLLALLGAFGNEC